MRAAPPMKAMVGTSGKAVDTERSRSSSASSVSGIVDRVMSSRGASWLKAHWSGIQRTVGLLFLGLVAVLVVVAAIQVKWDEVFSAMGSVSVWRLCLGASLTLAGYAAYACFDLIGRWMTRHGLAVWRTMLTAAICYAFTLGLGSLVGGLGLRLRLYTRQGVSAADAGHVFGMSVITNWTGYVLIAGTVFTFGDLQPLSEWGLSAGALHAAGAIMLAAGAAYLLLCIFSRHRSWTLAGHQVALPPWWLALIQVTVAMLNWALMGAVLYVVLSTQSSYGLVLATVLLSAVAGLIIRVPGGVGVLEAIAVAWLAADGMDQSAALAGVLIFRALYYLLPLFVAGLGYLSLEARSATSR